MVSHWLVASGMAHNGIVLCKCIVIFFKKTYYFKHLVFQNKRLVVLIKESLLAKFLLHYPQLLIKKSFQQLIRKPLFKCICCFTHKSLVVCISYVSFCIASYIIGAERMFQYCTSPLWLKEDKHLLPSSRTMAVSFLLTNTCVLASKISGCPFRQWNKSWNKQWYTLFLFYLLPWDTLWIPVSPWLMK